MTSCTLTLRLYLEFRNLRIEERLAVCHRIPDRHQFIERLCDLGVFTQLKLIVGKNCNSYPIFGLEF